MRIQYISKEEQERRNQNLVANNRGRARERQAERDRIAAAKTPQARACAEGGGLLFEIYLPPLPIEPNPETLRKLFSPGCGLDFMVFTGNMIPCGVPVTDLNGKTEKWCCPKCQRK